MYCFKTKIEEKNVLFKNQNLSEKIKYFKTEI